MDYIDIASARERDGLRLVLSAGVPGPWGEAAKAIFNVKNLDYTAVRQEAGGENEELHAWTGQTSAPVAIYNAEAPRSNSLDILLLAERLQPSPQLIPESVQQRVRMFGAIREIIGERGFAWYRRLLMLQPIMNAPGMEEIAQRLGGRYGYSEAELEIAPQRCAAVLSYLSGLLREQAERGSSYFIGNGMTALDIYWANFAAMVKPLHEDVNPMPRSLRATYEHLHPQVEAAVDPLLLEHRDFMYREHLRLPLDF